MPIHFHHRMKPSALPALVCVLGIACGAQAQDFDGMSKEQRKQFLSAYAEIHAIDQILPVCNELAPDYAAANEAIMAEFKASSSIDRARPLVDQFVSWAEGQNAAVGMALSLAAGVTQKAVRSDLAENPEKCGEAFRYELFDTAFDGSAALVKAYGLEAPAADVAEVEPVAPAAVEQPTPQPIQTATAAPIDGLAMPTPIGDRVDELPGLSWRMDNGVRRADSGGALCIWQCVVLQHAEESFPWLIIHKALPLQADEALDQVLAQSEKPVIEQEGVDATPFIGRMAMQPDQLVVRNAYIDDYGSDVDRREMFGLEKQGLTVVAELFYPDGINVLESSQIALSHVVSTLELDTASAQTALQNPTAPSIEAARGVPPTADQVIYAENPDPTHNALTLSLSYDDDARYLDKTVLEIDGPTIEMNDSTYYYVPPQPDGAVIEGVFTSADGYAGVGISVLKSKTLVFNRNGRYTTSASSGVVGGFLASTGSSSEGEGSYRINGYTLELRSDDGSAQQDVFFPYMSRTFWPGSDGPSDEFNFINVGGKILYRDDE